MKVHFHRSHPKKSFSLAEFEVVLVPRSTLMNGRAYETQMDDEDDDDGGHDSIDDDDDPELTMPLHELRDVLRTPRECSVHLNRIPTTDLLQLPSTESNIQPIVNEPLQQSDENDDAAQQFDYVETMDMAEVGINEHFNELNFNGNNGRKPF